MPVVPSQSDRDVLHLSEGAHNGIWQCILCKAPFILMGILRSQSAAASTPHPAISPVQHKCISQRKPVGTAQIGSPLNLSEFIPSPRRLFSSFMPVSNTLMKYFCVKKNRIIIGSSMTTGSHQQCPFSIARSETLSPKDSASPVYADREAGLRNRSGMHELKDCHCGQSRF